MYCVDLIQFYLFRYEDELAMSAIKREAVALYEKLRVVEVKRNELLIEEQERGTPGQVCYIVFRDLTTIKTEKGI